jgi:hypothetical protein
MQFQNWLDTPVLLTLLLTPPGGSSALPLEATIAPGGGTATVAPAAMWSSPQYTVTVTLRVGGKQYSLDPFPQPLPTVNSPQYPLPGSSPAAYVSVTVMPNAGPGSVTYILPPGPGGKPPAAQLLVRNNTADTVSVSANTAGFVGATVPSGATLPSPMVAGNMWLNIGTDSGVMLPPVASAAVGPANIAPLGPSQPAVPGDYVVFVEPLQVGVDPATQALVAQWPVTLFYVGESVASGEAPSYLLNVSNVAPDALVLTAASGQFLPTAWTPLGGKGPFSLPANTSAALVVSQDATLTVADPTTGVAVTTGAVTGATGVVAPVFSAAQFKLADPGPQVYANFLVGAPVAGTFLGQQLLLSSTMPVVVAATDPVPASTRPAGSPGPVLLYPAVDGAAPTALPILPAGVQPTIATSGATLALPGNGPVVARIVAASTTCPDDIAGQWSPRDTRPSLVMVATAAATLFGPPATTTIPGLAGMWVRPSGGSDIVFPLGGGTGTNPIPVESQSALTTLLVSTFYMGSGTCIGDYLETVCLAEGFSPCQPVVQYQQDRCLGYFHQGLGQLCAAACQGNVGTCETPGSGGSAGTAQANSIACGCETIANQCALVKFQGTPACACINRDADPGVVPPLAFQVGAGSSVPLTTLAQYKAAFTRAARGQAFPAQLQALEPCWWPPCAAQFPGLKDVNFKTVCGAPEVQCFAAVNDVVTDSTSIVNVDISQACGSGNAYTPGDGGSGSGSGSEGSGLEPDESKGGLSTPALAGIVVAVVVVLVGAVVAVVLLAKKPAGRPISATATAKPLPK